MIGFLVACKNEEDPIKSEGARVVTTLFIYFFDIQGQLTPKSVIEFCRNSIPFELLWLLEIFMFESVDGWRHARTDERTPARVPYYKLTLSLRLS